MITVLEALWKSLTRNLFTLSVINLPQSLFNPYADIEPTVDCSDAAQVRRQNLQNYFSSFIDFPRLLVIGETPGWRGCRFSGVPFTSEAQLASGGLNFYGKPSSRTPKLFTESSATIFWRVMHPFQEQFLVWNSLPFHPHQPHQPLSNRRVSLGEVRGYQSILTDVLEILQPERVLAVGRVAHQTLTSLGIAACYVRHPSHGGANEFNTGIQAFFSKMGIDPCHIKA